MCNRCYKYKNSIIYFTYILRNFLSLLYTAISTMYIGRVRENTTKYNRE